MSLLAHGEPCALDAGRPEPAHVELSSKSWMRRGTGQDRDRLELAYSGVAGLTGSPI
jgi:hypothetical protein